MIKGLGTFSPISYLLSSISEYTSNVKIYYVFIIILGKKLYWIIYNYDLMYTMILNL